MSRAGVSVEPILRDLPEWFESERLSIRPPRPGDGSMVLEAVRDSLADLRRIPALMRWALAEPSIESSERFCRDGYSNFLARRDLPLLLLRKQSGVMVGSSGLHRMDWSVPSFEVGFLYCTLAWSAYWLGCIAHCATDLSPAHNKTKPERGSRRAR